MCCKWLAGNTGRKKSTKIRHLRTITQLCLAVSLQLRQLKHQYRLHMSPQYGELQPLTVEIDLPVWGTPANFNGFRMLPSLLQRHRSPYRHHLWPSPGLLHYIYIFGGSGPLTEFCRVQNSLYVQVLRSPISATLLNGTPAAGVSLTLRRGTRNGITQLSQRAPLIFGWAAITLRLVHILALSVFMQRPRRAIQILN